MNVRNFLFTTAVALIFSGGTAGLTLAQRPAPPIHYTLDYYDTDGLIRATNTSGPSVGISSAGAISVPTIGAEVLLSTMLASSDQLVWRLNSATAVNENSQIAGSGDYFTGGSWVRNVAYRYSPVSGSTPVVEPILPTSGNVGLYVGGINDLGDVAGFAHGATAGSLATSKSQIFRSVGIGINDLGEWVGQANTGKSKATEQKHAAVFSGSKLIDLGVLPGGTYSQAYSINFNGTVVGFSGSSTGQQGFVYMGGYMYSVPEVMLTALPTGVSALIPRHINNAGHISGEVVFTGTTVRGGFVRYLHFSEGLSWQNQTVVVNV